MRSRIRLGLFGLCFHFLIAPNITFAQTRPEALPPLDSLDFMALWRIGNDLFDQSKIIEQTIRAQEDAADKDLELAQLWYDAAKQDSSSSKAVVDSLSKVLKKAKANFQKANKLLKKAENNLELTSGMSDMDSLNLRKNLPKAWKEFKRLYEELYPETILENSENEAVVEKKSREKKKKKQPKEPSSEKEGETMVAKAEPAPSVKQATRFAKYNPAADVMLNPPLPPCVIASSNRDEFSGEVLKETARSELFRYTNPALRTYLQGKTHVVCEAALTTNGTQSALLLTFNINDPNARKAFGRLEKNSIATLKFLDGSILELQNAIADDGVFSPDNDASIFRAQYSLNPAAIKKIRRTGIDKLRILWSKGYDDYDVQQVDLLMRQAECLFK
ncbi:MAG: hypothetical protein ACKVT2_00135 [Saprospiraceae bacterium]